jgi:chemotaxis protein methyltransferase CheR
MSTASRPRAGGLPDVRGLRIPDRTVELLRDLIASHAGIHYDDDRLDLLRERIVPMAIERGFDSLLDYYYLLKYDAGAALEWPRVMDALSVQETYFWREADQFRALVTAIVPQLVDAGHRHIRIWSIPCATGEEPLSIAMALEEDGAFRTAAIEIHAADASQSALAKAAQRRYGRRSFRQLPDDLRDRYFTRDGDKEEWIVSPQLFSRVTSWSRINIINEAETAPLAASDVVFCRNLFIYFTPASVLQVVTRLGAAMPSPGFLCVGAAESLLRLSTVFELKDVGGAYVYVKS